MTYLGAFLMLVGALGIGLVFLAIALNLLPPDTGGYSMIVATLTGAGGAEIVARSES